MFQTNVRVKSHAKSAFADWQAKFHSCIVAHLGFVSLEFRSSPGPSQTEWEIVQRFCDAQSLFSWRESKQRRELIDDLQSYVEDPIQERELDADSLSASATEVFITEVSPDMDSAYRNWIAKIHRVEAKFPGFKSMYVQSPISRHSKTWITLLQFDNQVNLDRWLASHERQEVLNESKAFIASLESHRMISPYAGWFSSIATGGVLPSVWKQTMLILLLLFPIVMLELAYLSPLTLGLGLSLATFIGNAISVTLLTWPMMPIAIFFLGWWLSDTTYRKTVIGTSIVIALYLIEIVIFQNFI